VHRLAAPPVRPDPTAGIPAKHEVAISPRTARRLKCAYVDPISAIKDSECPPLQLLANQFVSDRFDAELGGLSIPRDTS
jgi:hypothetical protein